MKENKEAKNGNKGDREKGERKQSVIDLDTMSASLGGQ